MRKRCAVVLAMLAGIVLGSLGMPIRHRSATARNFIVEGVGE